MTKFPQLLVVDDDREIRELLAKLLSRRGFAVTAVGNGQEMNQVLERADIDLVILDIMLPGEDGLAICRDLRSRQPTPIIMLSARGDPVDRVVGLEMGADDYLPKPFDLHELAARIRAVLRRAGADANGPTSEREPELCFAGWKLSRHQRQLLSPEGATIDLTSAEFAILLAFAERPQRVVSRGELGEAIHGRHPTALERSIDVHVSRLRRKIEANPSRPVLIRTVRDAGYMLTAPVTQT